MTVSRFSAQSAPLPQDANSETSNVMLAPEDLLGNGEGVTTVIQPLQAAKRPCPPGITLVGTRRDDVLRGTGNADRLVGLAGNDRLLGEGCDDELLGGGGRDRLFGGRRDDRLFGDAGRDRLVGNRGDDRLFGGDGPDDLRGNVGDDLLEGGADQDALFGSSGNDRLFGQGGTDVIFAGRGNDEIVGGLQRDRLIGGGGSNRFVYNSFGERGDTIVDFDRRRDVLDVSRLFQGSDFTNSDPFKEYVIIVREAEDTTIIRVDSDGDRGSEPFKTLVTLEDVNFDDVGRRNFVF